MKNIYIILLSLILLAGIGNQANAQSITVNGSTFLPQDSIAFTYNRPSFTSTDWIGIYKSGVTPGAGSISWKYIKSETGTLKLKAPQEAGKYKAYLLCCDGYDVVATSVEFSIEIPSLSTSFPSYVQGDSVVFSYVSPKFSPTDRIAIYTEGSKPGKVNPAIDPKYITSKQGSLTFKTPLSTGYYDAYLLCCNGYDSISACSFQIIDQATAFLNPSTQNYASGAPILINYNDPAYAAGDWIGIYMDGMPAQGQSITWSGIVSKSGSITFPAVLSGGYYYAALFNKDNIVYASSIVFNIPVETSGSYVKTSASIYPDGNTILVNYKDIGYSSKDWIGIYKKDQIPGSGPQALVWNYAANDSSTIEFTSLAIGDYVVYLLCCDGYDIKAKYDFKVVGTNTPSLVLTQFAYNYGDPLEFTYNDPAFSSTDWLGIYKASEIPGGAGVYSTWWRYMPDKNGTMLFSYPDNYGENTTTGSLAPGDYWGGLFCCDGYGLYAQATFTVLPEGVNGILELSLANRLTLYPNPSNGLVTVKLADMSKIQRIVVYNVTGQIKYQEKLNGVNQKTLDLKHLGKGIFFIEAVTEKYKTSKKLIIH